MSTNPFSYIEDAEIRKTVTDGAIGFLAIFFGRKEFEIRARWDSFGDDVALFNFFKALLFWDHISSQELKTKATSLAVVSMLSTIEGFMPMQGNQERVVQFFMDYLSEDSQNKMLASFVFSKSDNFKNAHLESRHLMYERASLKTGNYTEDCSTGIETASICSCYEWLITQNSTLRRQYISLLAKKLYSMRNSVVHDATYVRFVHTEKKPVDVALWNMTLTESFTVSKDKRKFSRHVWYSTSLYKNDLFDIFKDSLWSYFESPMVTTVLSE